ncbi:NTF2 fold immunity protein of polymorphic toxin system component [Flavobacterium sp. 90]|uniref:NTF2 fold immunity protein n=1 Tax=unclassified Flavobacterium TaxID=196869 RepID=UPI000EAD1614|nr:MULTISPECIES: NTF2 fold immunity protein [unclassified Flavobacterium]RKR05201.1 NTF2 fold immunity protein of polymorphic toxin system component [Flavobacterium sp. 81]TCK56516.1 NTF2 fold immunity protein of polymorphic toxin system component [Flavobacterium sp. 90]
MKYFFLSLLLVTLGSCAQNKRLVLGKENAKEELKIALSKKSQHNVIDYKELIIKDSVTAIKVAEPILIDIYGKENIEKQKPYETYLLENYWVISGTLPADYSGGTFLIIIDARNSQVIKITHGK